MLQLLRVFVLALIPLASCHSLSAQVNAYAVNSDSGGTQRLFAIDISTSASTLVGVVPSGTSTQGLAWGGAPSTLWSVASSSIGTLSTTSANYTLRRVLPSNAVDLTWSAQLGEFWITSYEGNNIPSLVHAFAPSTNTLRTVGTLPFASRYFDLDFDRAGNLWIFVGNELHVAPQNSLAFRFITYLERPLRALSIDTTTGTFYAYDEPRGLVVELDPATGSTRAIGGPTNLSIFEWLVIPGACAGRFLPTGTSCPGTGGIAPILDGYGCYGAGGTVHLSLRQAMSGATGILLFGLGPASIPLGNGCELNIGPVFADPIIALPLFGTGGAGQGFTTVNFVVPQGAVVASLALQALVFDVGAPGGFAATNGLRIVVE